MFCKQGWLAKWLMTVASTVALYGCGANDASRETSQHGLLWSMTPSATLSPARRAGTSLSAKTALNWQGPLVATTTTATTTSSDSMSPNNTVTDWRSPATLTVSRCIAPPNYGGGYGGYGGNGLPGGYNPGPGLCGYKPAFHRATIGWGSSEIERRRVVPSARVRFGPFTLKHSAIGDAAGYSDTYRISVWARSPGVYGADGLFQGAQANLVKIGETSATLTGFESRQVYVTATLPGVFSALQLRASVMNKSSSYPASCGALPSSSSNPTTLDADCIQAAVNPLAVVTPRWTPLAILYEPPGNCSWSNLTQEHTAGAAIATTRTSGTSSQVISDRGFFWDKEHSDITTENSSANSRRTEVRISRIDSVGTRLGLPLANPGNPQCNTPGAEIQPRDDAGPGRGDIFVLLKNASMIYWNTANLSGSTLSPVGAPNVAESMVVVTAHQIRSGTGLPPGVSFTPEERDAILGLSAYTLNADGSVSDHLSDSRFVALGQVIELGQGLALEHSLSQQMSVGGSQTLTQLTKNRVNATQSDPVVDLSIKALTYGGSLAASAGAAKILTALGGGFAELADKTEGIGIPELFTDQSERTVVTSYGRTSFVEHVADSAVTQQFYLQDTSQGLSVALYFDTLFGTYVFAPHTAGAGWAYDANLQQLPVLTAAIVEQGGESDTASLPTAIQSQLNQLGAVELQPASAGSYSTTRGTTKVQPSELVYRSTGFTLEDLPSETAVGNRTQTLYVARDTQGRAVAQLWITVDAGR